METDLHSVGRGLYGNGLIRAMWDRPALFLLGLGGVTAALTVGGWLIATGELRSFDGLFLFSTSLVIEFAFGLCFALATSTSRVRGASACAPCDCRAACK
jgi:hypothetical protein